MFAHTERGCKGSPVQRERERIKKEEEMEDRLAELESIRNVTQKAEFVGTTQAGSSRALMQREHACQRETQLAHTALTLVRREALRRVLEQERELYSKELSQRGLAIYQQRI